MHMFVADADVKSQSTLISVNNRMHQALVGRTIVRSNVQCDFWQFFSPPKLPPLPE